MKFKITILSLIFLGLFVGDLKLFCSSEEQPFLCDDDEYEYVEVVDDENGEVETDDESDPNLQDPNNESKKSRPLVTFLKFATVAVVPAVITYFVGRTFGADLGRRLGYDQAYQEGRGLSRG